MRDAVIQNVANVRAPRPANRDAAGRAAYTFVAAIAKGGMGYVELCCRRDGRFVRWAARKRLHESLRGDQTFRTMFMDEARLAGLIRHPNVVGVSDVGEDAEGPYLIMDYVEGLSLSRVVRRAAQDRCPVPMQVAVRIGKDAAVGLHAAHEVRAEDGSSLNLVHRDVSPQNILIGFDGSVRVTDFGIAKALGNATETSAGVLKGNMGYLSPEQLRFEEPDRRSDLFSLGVALYELLTAERLYANKEGFEGTHRILTELPPDVRGARTDVPPALAELLLEMLAKTPTARPATALAVAARLERILMELMAQEGARTVADYMGQHFASAREVQRGLLAEGLRTTAEAPTVATATAPTVAAPTVAAPTATAPTRLDWRPARPAPRTWPSRIAATVAIALMAAAGIRLARRHDVDLPAVPLLAAAVPTPSEVLPLPPPEWRAVPAVPDARVPALEWSASPHHDSSHRARAHRTTARRARVPSSSIAVPLFTRWR